MQTEWTQETWHRAYAEMLSAFEKHGIPQDVAKLFARELKTERALRRMTGYLLQMKHVRMEDIADEMLAIAADRDQWARKRQNEESNARYTAWLNSAERKTEE